MYMNFIAALFITDQTGKKSKYLLKGNMDNPIVEYSYNEILIGY